MGADNRPDELISYYVKARAGAQMIAGAIGFLALLWSTVVLLGGFVSILRLQEFWFLTLLSFLMASNISKTLETGATTSGNYVADVNILHLSKGQNRCHWMVRSILFTAVAVKMLLMICVMPIISISPYVALGLSVARLIQRDYGNADGDAANKAKLNAALIIFYVLVMFQSLSVLYWAFLQSFEPWFSLSKKCEFGVWGPKIVKRYRAQTNDMCHKDGLLPNNWNLITFSVGLVESASPDDRLWGTRVLDASIEKGIPIRQELLSSNQAIHNLIDVIGLTEKDNREIRERAARVVAHLGSELQIIRFPSILRCICYLLESCNQYSDPEVAHSSENSDKTIDKAAHLSLEITDKNDHNQVVNVSSAKLSKRAARRAEWDMYFGKQYKYSYLSNGTKELISQGLVILERLTQDEEDCIEIIKHQRLLSKITLPLSYPDLLSHGWDHTWVEMLSRSLTVVSRLIRAGPGEDTTRLRHDMSRNTVAIGNLMLILEDDSEGAFSELRGQAIEILTELSFDGSFRKLAFDESTSMTEMLVKMLRHIMLEESNAIIEKQDEEKINTVRRKAGEALARLLCVPSARDDSDAFSSRTNFNAVDLLPKRDMIKLLTRVVNQILSSKGEIAEDVVTLVASSNGSHVEMVVESQPPNGSESDTQKNEEQPEDSKMLAAMLSLTVAICNNKTVISEDDFTGAIPDDTALVKKLKEIAETNMDATVDGWRIQKLVCEIVMAVVQLKPGYIRELNEHNFKEALSKALETMSDVDNCMIFGGDDCEVPARSLASLVKEAQKLLAQDQGDIIST